MCISMTMAFAIACHCSSTQPALLVRQARLRFDHRPGLRESMHEECVDTVWQENLDNKFAATLFVAK